MNSSEDANNTLSPTVNALNSSEAQDLANLTFAAFAASSLYNTTPLPNSNSTQQTEAKFDEQDYCELFKEHDRQMLKELNSSNEIEEVEQCVEGIKLQTEEYALPFSYYGLIPSSTSTQQTEAKFDKPDYYELFKEHDRQMLKELNSSNKIEEDKQQVEGIKKRLEKIMQRTKRVHVMEKENTPKVVRAYDMENEIKQKSKAFISDENIFNFFIKSFFTKNEEIDQLVEKSNQLNKEVWQEHKQIDAEKAEIRRELEEVAKQQSEEYIKSDIEKEEIRRMIAEIEQENDKYTPNFQLRLALSSKWW